MKILIIGHTYIAPINHKKWTTLAQLFPEVTLQVITPQYWPGHLFDHVVEHEKYQARENCSFIALPTFKQGNEMLYGYYPQHLKAVLQLFQPDVLHVEQGDNALSYFESLLLARAIKKKVHASFFTWINWRLERSFKYRFIWRWIERYNLQHSAGAVVGNADAQHILQEKGFHKPMVVLPQLGIDLQEFAAPLERNDATQRIGFIGRFVEEKGIFTLVDAFDALHGRFPAWELQLVGNGPAREKLLYYIAKKKSRSQIHVRASVPHEQVPALLHDMDIFVLPSYDTPQWREQFGHVIIEAMAARVPVIGSTGGEIPQVIADTGLVFDAKNSEQLAALLERLMSSELLRDTLARKGYERVSLHYSHEAIAQKMYQFWQLISS